MVKIYHVVTLVLTEVRNVLLSSHLPRIRKSLSSLFFRAAARPRNAHFIIVPKVEAGSADVK